MSWRSFSVWLYFLLCVALTALSGTALAAEPEAAPPESPAALADPLGRETPRSTISALIKALAEHDYDRAAQFIDAPADGSQQRIRAAARARDFHVTLDNGGTLEAYAALSNEPVGRLNDNLPVEHEHVGEITRQDNKVPILLVRGEDGGQLVWRISQETLKQIPAPVKQPVAPEKQQALDPDQKRAQTLEQERAPMTVAGAPLKDWVQLAGLGAFIFGSLWALSALVLAATRRLVPDPAENGFYRFFEAAFSPFILLIAVIVFSDRAEQQPVAIVARQTLLRYTGIVAVIAFVWFGLRLVDAIAELVISRMQHRQRRQAVSIVTLLRRTAKVILLLFSGIGILDTFGIDVTTGIAALGIGGIALALGAQKTVENLVGSVTVIADRPAQVGDFIKVGDVVGTVEDIGIRSTRIRTAERTVVTIPNGDLSSRHIENFATRERFLFNPVIAVDHTTPSPKLREAIGIVRQVLAGHDKIEEGARANLARIGERSFNIDVLSYIDVREFDASVLIREELLLSIYEQLEAAGIGLAFQRQIIVLPPGQPEASPVTPEAEAGKERSPS